MKNFTIHQSIQKSVQKLSILHHMAVKIGITIDLRQTQLVVLLKVLIGFIYSQVTMSMSKTNVLAKCY